MEDCLTILCKEIWGREKVSFLWLRLAGRILFTKPHRMENVYIRLARHFHLRNRPLLSRFMRYRLRVEHASIVSPDALIGPGLTLPHPVSVVIGPHVAIGDNCTIFQCTSIGGRSSPQAPDEQRVVVEDDVRIYAGARITGDTTVGRGSIIGANAVVTQDLEPGSFSKAVPAIIKKLN